MSNTPQDIELLKTIVQNTRTNAVTYIGVTEATALAQQGLIEGNPSLRNEIGQIAYRATESGLSYIDHMTAVTAPATPAAPPAPPAPVAAPPAPVTLAQADGPSYRMVANFALPEKGGRRKVGGQPRLYPFDRLEVGQAIFVPATEERPDVKKSLASTVSSANRRYRAFEPRRYFIVERALKGQVFGSEVAPADGAYIVRVAPPAA